MARLRRWAALAGVAGVLLACLAGAALAYRVGDDAAWTGTTGNATTGGGTGIATINGGSGLTATFSTVPPGGNNFYGFGLGSAGALSGSIQMGDAGFSGAWFSPQPTAANTFILNTVLGGNTTWNGSVGTGTSDVACRPAVGIGQVADCHNSTFTINFSQPVTDPVLHVSQIAGSSTMGTNGWNDSQVLTLTTPGATTTLLASNGQLSLVNNVIFHSNLSYTGGAFATACSAAAAPQLPSACGSVRINGTYTSLSFNTLFHVVRRTGTGTITGLLFADGVGLALTVSEDFGDAPASYDPGAAASHIVGDLRLGSAISTENANTINTGAVTPSPIANATASSDANDDGAIFPAAISTVTGGTTTVPVTLSGASKAGSVCGWIDFNRNGTFQNTAPAEGACQPFSAGATSVSLVFTTPAGATAGASFARVRATYDTAFAALPTGAVNSGEVEDFAVTLAPADYTDAPASYGSASHVIAGTGQLGASVTGDATDFNTPAANGDIDNGLTPPLIDVNGVSAYALTVPVSGVTLASDLCGWIDFDRNGAFETAERACASVGIGGTSANLSWTMPVSTTYVAGNSYLRLRLGTTTGQVGSPTGATDSGEVEDYTVSLLPRVRLVKALSPTTDPGLFNLSITPTVSPAGSALSTDQGNNGSAPATAGTFAPVGLNTAITISETAGTGTALTSYNSSRACVNRAGGVVLAAGAGSSGSFTSMTSASTGTNLTPATTTNINDTEVICTITNGVVVDLSVTKTNTPGVNGNIDQADDTLTSGSLTTYEVRVTNNGPGSVTGAVVTDTPGAGVTCPGGNAVTITGDGIPAGAFTVGNLTSTGIALGTLNNGQAATLSFTCTVQ